MDDSILNFDIARGPQTIIKVIGVGGGGGNAVNHMYKKGIHNVSFVLCNTDIQALKRSDVPDQIVLGHDGLGAGNQPKKAIEAAEASMDDIRKMLDDGTKMVFITAGMGGGTGTGAAPVIARTAKEMGILTVGIVTIPFLFEGRPKILQALNGVEEISRNVDALLVINNERLREIYADLTVMNAFGKADDTLTTAAKSIAEIITLPGLINVDFADVHTTMKDGGVALMSNGFGQGEGRVQQAVMEALESPLLSNNDVRNARKMLLNIYFSEESELLMEEMTDIHDFMSEFNPNIEVIWGTAIDNTLGDKIKIMIIATGFTTDVIPEIAEEKKQRSFLRSEKELKEEEERRLKAERENAMVGQYYGVFAKHTGRSIPRPHIVVLTEAELDDDSLITLLEDNPPYNRSSALVVKARAKSATAEVPFAEGEPAVTVAEAPVENKPIIRF